MAITFSCHHCGKSLTTSDDKAGRKAKCPGCGEVLMVPESTDDFALGVDSVEESEELPTAPRTGTNAGTQTCPMCGAKNSRRARTCEECGEKLSAADDAGQTDPRHAQYAGFWLRFVALIIDNILMGCVSGLIGGVVGFALALALIGANNGNPNVVQDEATQAMFNLIGYVIGLLIGWLYFAFMESSASQATLGKMAVGIKVCDLDGRRITFGKATGRYFAKILSGLICVAGYIMAGFTEKKQALHDMLAGTLVVKK